MGTSSTDTGRSVVSSLQAHLFALPDLQDRPYTEALFTTFNVDLGFFEQRVLGLARASGAAVTILADASQYNPDPLAVHGAGSSYLVGVVDLATAFHPKVTVLVGPDRALVAVGSGNLTTGGWLGNDETLFVATGDTRTGVPAIIGQVGSWLESVQQLRTSSAARAAVARVRRVIDQLTTAGPALDDGARLVSTSSGPILEQLPATPADELLLHAPFHDHAGAALSALLDRFRPQRVSIAVQPGKTVIDPEALARATAARNVTLTWHDAGDGYRHGKLIEAVSSSGRWVLTGSANLTGAALLRPIDENGNCEVGVVAEMPTSLYPGAGAPLVTGSIPTVKIQTAPREDAHSSEPVPVLVSATSDGADVVVELARATPFDVDVDVSEYDDQPELTALLGTIPPGADGARLVSGRALGARSRIRLRYERDGAQVRGPFHFLADPEAVLRRMQVRRSATTNTDVDWRALFGDEHLWRDWTRTLDRVTREQRVTPAARRSATHPPESASLDGDHARRTFDDEEGWARYAQDAVDRLGPTLAHEASGGAVLPHLARSQPSVGVRTPRWADKFDADESDFDDEHSADDLDEDLPPDDSPRPEDAPALTAHHKKRVRKWVTELTSGIDERPALDRLAFARLVLIASLAPIWDPSTFEWFMTLRDATASLVAGELPTRLQAEAASLAAVCLLRLDQAASPDRRTGSGKAYVELVEDLRPLLAAVDPDRVATLVRAIYGESLTASSPQAVLEHLATTIGTNPWPEIVRLVQAEHPDWSVRLDGDAHLRIVSRTGHPLTIAAAALRQVPAGLTAAIHVTAGLRLDQRVYVRHGDVFVVEDRLGPRTVWKTYRLGALVTPASIADGDAEVRARIDRPPWSSISVTARDALTAAGVEP